MASEGKERKRVRMGHRELPRQEEYSSSETCSMDGLYGYLYKATLS